MDTDSAPTQPLLATEGRPVRLDFKSGGWVLLLSMSLVTALVVWRIYVIQDARKWRDNVAPPASMSNGFDLTRATVQVGLIGNRRQPDGAQALVDPPVMTIEQLEPLNESKWTKYLVPDDRVLGVSLGGESRAYPARVLTWHEVANDTLGGIPIAVTYCPFSGSATAYDRRLGDRVVELRMSGLVYNANILLYDLQGNRDRESLWSQVTGAAIAGPEAEKGSTLARLECQFMDWRDWKLLHPDTTVMGADLRMKKQYRSDPYQNYALSPGVPYPYEPALPSTDASRVKEPVLVARVAGTTVAFGAQEVASRVDPGGSWRTEIAGIPVVLVQRADLRLGTSTWIQSLDPAHPVESVFNLYRFAWNANFPAGRQP